ncbi:uncharacterized protein LOC132701013 [Cylas formicarius]|uniref:uncharacterized protein LOC132701013 n=1 Tax=Cylas formicarius TaxID=197179 RepID=UPI002958623E|nr:uncharacterized protein LOC132701013 [Cylas formicarius]
MNTLRIGVVFLFFTSSNQKCPKLITTFSQVNCTDRATDIDAYFYSLDESISCVPKCESYSSNLDASCESMDDKCMPGYACEKRCGPTVSLREFSCETDDDCIAQGGNARTKCKFYCVAKKEESCMAYHCNTEDYVETFWTAQKFKPVCDNDGNYQAKQCKGGLSGKCFCYSAKGKRIFGQALRADADDMTCACSRRKAELEEQGHFYVSLHCDSMGNYEQLQCDAVSEQCWCVEPKTGDLTSAVVPMKAMIKLPCYSTAVIGSQYLRQCESKKYAQELIVNKLRTHGAKWITTDFLLCDGDGAYGAYMLSSGIAYCTWRDNSKIGTWQSNVEAGVSVDCNCAKDFMLYNHNQACEGNGNYKTLQQTMNGDVTYYYCVDSDGFAKTDFLTNNNIDCSLYY